MKFIISLLIIVSMLLTQSCGGNRDAETAFKAATAGLSENNVLMYAEDAYAELSDLNIEDACKLTLVYYYLYSQNYEKKYGDCFGRCYEYATGKGEADANDYFNELTGEENAATMLKKAYQNLDIMRQAYDTFDEMRERDTQTY